MKYLGIDFGSKRIGIAVSDEQGKFALPKKVIQNRSDVNLVVTEVAEMVRELGIGEIVIGESKNYQGESNSVMKQAAEFAGALAQVTGLPVYNEPEFMTSHQAERTQHELTGGSSRGKVVNRDMLDASAAAIILQSYLDKIAVPAVDVD